MTTVADPITSNNSSLIVAIIEEQKIEHPNLSKNDLAVHTFQRNHKFKYLFDQLGYGSEACVVAIEALMRVSAQYGLECYAAKAEVNRVYLESANAINISKEDI